MVLALYLPELVLVYVVILKIIDGVIHGSSTSQMNREPLEKLLGRDSCHPVFSYIPMQIFALVSLERVFPVTILNREDLNHRIFVFSSVLQRISEQL